ncbi:hypothetical protein ACTFIY_009481 [Dictyostelium cf. discoideum]
MALIIKNEIIQFKKASYYLPHYKFDDGIYFTQSQSVLNYKKNGFSTNQLGIRNEQSPFISYTSYIDIAEEPFRFLKGHAAKGKALFPGDSTDPQIGFECSGIITRIGKKVNKFKIGDSVLGTCFHSVASHVITNQDRFVLKPGCLSYVEAASIPLVYITSYYSLLVQGGLNLERNDEEIVLIHSGTGGIGLAAIEILKAIGFKSLLFVTVSSKEKEHFLRYIYGSFITEIYSTRNTDYVQDIKKKIKEIKKGKGKSLTQYGTLSYGVVSITHLSTTETTDYNKFKYFVGYSTVEVVSPGFSKVKDSLQIVVNMINDGKLKILPIIEYPVNEIKNAVEYMSERKHIGKIVVNFQTTKDLVQDIIIKSNNSIENNYLFQYNINNTTFGNTILITGQKGLSLTIIKWILYYYPNQDNNNNDFIKDIIVLSKSTINYELEIEIGRARKKGLKTNIHFKQVDVSNKNQLYESIDELYKSNKGLKPIETIFHNAFVPVQSEPEDIDLQQIIDSNSAKTNGAINLYNYISSKVMILKNYIISSSMASVMGSIRQCGYCCANAVIDSFSKYLRRKGIQCFSLKYSIIEQSGYVARNESVKMKIVFIGIYLLYDLIILENYKKVYCLLNINNSKEEGFKTIIQLLKEYKLFDKLTNDQINKIEIVCGHYSKEQFGMPNEDYNNLSNQVNIVLNCATDRNLNKKYEQFNEQLESIGVYQEDPNTDDDYYLPPLGSIDNIKSGYIQNRIIQEYRLRNANKIHGLPIMVIRLPFLFSDDNTGIGRDNDIVMLLLQSCYLMNTWPSELENQLLNLVPVTFVSKSISSTISSNIWNQCKSLSPINNLITFNSIVDHISFGSIMNQLSNDLGWRKISTLQFIKKLDIYDNESCKTLSSFIKNQNFFNSLSIDGQYNFNQSIKNELISNNKFNGYKVDKNSIIKHLSYTFKKKIL